jgi:hypothetical protein
MKHPRGPQASDRCVRDTSAAQALLQLMDRLPTPEAAGPDIAPARTAAVAPLPQDDNPTAMWLLPANDAWHNQLTRLPHAVDALGQDPDVLCALVRAARPAAHARPSGLADSG